MKKFCFRIIIVALLIGAVMGSANAATLLIPVGKTIGLNLDSAGITVVDFQKDGPCPAKEAGLSVGDVILKAGDEDLHSAEELQAAVKEGTGPMELTVRRKGDLRKVTVMPGTGDGRRQLGIYVRDGISGIGTVTYYDPETGRFGALGHGVNTADGELVDMESGTAMTSTVVEVKRGQVGHPGQLRGAFSQSERIGELTANTKCGLFGKSETGWSGEPVPVAEPGEVRIGEAEILSNVSGTKVERYRVEILKLYPGDRADGRNILLQVTDENLLQRTGGIVQGMSGSPILQNGKLIGAVTHVLVNDPKTGYGIFMENMLDAAA